MDLFEAQSSHDAGGKTRIPIPREWKVEATFGGDQDCYRYKLMHRWGSGPLAMFAMMNPSVADLRVMDPTVAKTAKIASRLGYGGQFIANCCAYRTTDKLGLLTIEDPVGPDNHASILEMASEASLIVVAHGNLPRKLQCHADAMCRLLRGAGHALHAFRLSKSGTPWHPLYLPNAAEPIAWVA